jgi:CDP-4-dehydro-6-deoxyglucose reductase, E3
VRRTLPPTTAGGNPRRLTVYKGCALMPGPITVRLAARRTVAKDVVDFEFTVLDPPRLRFEGGQFVTLTVGMDADGRTLRRSYSIASQSDDTTTLRLVMRLIQGGTASDFFARLQVGAEVEMTGPHGFFVLAPHHEGDVLFAATGTGIAPVLPMLGEVRHRREPGRRLVYWGVREEGDLFLRDEIQALCDASDATLLTFLSRPADAWTGLRGRITAAVLEALPGLRAPTFYLVGNGAMISELKAGLVAGGIDRKKQIRTEAFFD